MSYTINHGGMMFGMNMMYLSWGYIMVVSFLKYSNYVPDDFFYPIFNNQRYNETSKERMS